MVLDRTIANQRFHVQSGRAIFSRAVWPFRVFAMLGWLTAAMAMPANPLDFASIEHLRDVSTGSEQMGWGYSVNTASFRNQSLTTAIAADGSKFQFTSYFNSSGRLVVARRKMETDGWSNWFLRSTEFTSLNVSNAHTVCSIGIDGDGYLHASWGMHASGMLYSRSSTPVVNDLPFAMIGDTLGNSQALGAEFSPLTSAVTYPQFYNIPDSGNLLFCYRVGGSGNGDMVLWEWQDSENQWLPVHASPSRPWIARDYLYDSFPNANAYINKMVYDSAGNLHTTWTWRTGSDSLTPFKDYQSNHNIMYAWSPDDGQTWLRADGSIYERSGIHAIDEANAPPAVVITEGSSLMNQTHMSVGANGTVYVAGIWAPEADSGNHLRQYMLARYDGSEWALTPISNRAPEYVNSQGTSMRIPESMLGNYWMVRPLVAVDEQDRVFVVYTDWQDGNRLAIAVSEDPARQDWQHILFTDFSMLGWEPTLDLVRWQQDGVLSMFYQRPHLNQAVVGVFEWDARRFFAQAIPEPSVLACLGAFLAFAALKRP